MNIKKTFHSIISYVTNPKVSGENLSKKAIKISLLLAVIASLSLAAVVMVSIVPHFKKEIFPNVVNVWPQDKSVTISKSEGMTTSTGKEIIVSVTSDNKNEKPFLIKFDPNKDYTPEEFTASGASVLVTKKSLMAVNKDQIRVVPVSQFAGEKESVVIDKEHLQTMGQGIFKVVPWLVLGMLCAGIIGFTILFVGSLFVTALWVSILLWLVSKIIKKSYTFKQLFYVSLELAFVSLIIKAILSIFMLPVHMVMFVITLGLGLNWLITHKGHNE